MGRSIVAVIVGYLVFGVSAGLLFGLSSQDPHVSPRPGFLIFSVFYGVAFALLAGFVAALIARRNEVAHAGGVAAIIALAALISMVAQIGSGAIWSELSALLLMAPAAVAGGLIRRRLLKEAGA